MAVKVTLSRDELIHVGTAGLIRQVDALLRKRGSHFEHVDSFQHHICAAWAEYAVAKWRGKFWQPMSDAPTTLQADVGANGQVRSGQRPNHPLIVRAKDREDQPYVLVTYDVPHFTIVGWAWGHEAKQERYLRPADGDKPPAWFVPQRDLHPINAPVRAVA